ncbi:class I SAM-dependent methyltransferase [Bacillus sp. FJAT-49732]|uniref:Class I SAM-dependent methyltransferase n=1 Tax=Lederbergia citrisecunda TaxID=2833583 RepID=A0A942TU48_9BACI|nr:class I SAM-dependent methyltransferase [Lederbergia citrisecunda]MBS4201794.1 class I SAM-dependent methyltransferase [Lederbergia citrisecunda]
MSEHISIQSYNKLERAADYNTKKGFDPKRKEEMLDVALSLLLDLTPKGTTILELGAGSGLFTKKLINTEHFNEILVTDGAEAMLDIARNELESDSTNLVFTTLDFTRKNWSEKYMENKVEAVTSSMALHHADDKRVLFKEIYNVLDDGGSFVFADHMAGSSPLVEKLIGNKRARIKLASSGEDINAEDKIENFIISDKAKQQSEGNKCESTTQYLNYLHEAGFVDVDCIWRDYWLAVFVAIKPRYSEL